MDWMKDRTKEEIYRKGQALSCPISPLLSSEDIVKSEQYQARDFFVEMDHPGIGRLKFPSSPYRFAETPWQLNRVAPRLGEHNEEIFGRRLGCTREERVKLKEAGII